MPDPDFDEFVRLCRTSAEAEAAEPDLRRVEPSLLGVLEFLKQHPKIRPEAAGYLVEALDRRGAAADRLLEFCMRELQWPEVRHAIVQKAEGEQDPDRKRWLWEILDVYEPEWADADLFAYFSGNRVKELRFTGAVRILAFAIGGGVFGGLASLGLWLFCGGWGPPRLMAFVGFGLLGGIMASFVEAPEQPAS